MESGTGIKENGDVLKIGKYIFKSRLLIGTGRRQDNQKKSF